MKIKNLVGKPLKVAKSRTEKERKENKIQEFTVIAKGEASYKFSMKDKETKARLLAMRDANLISFEWEEAKDVRDDEKAVGETAEDGDKDSGKGSVSRNKKKNKGK